MAEYAPVLADVHDIERQFAARRESYQERKRFRTMIEADPGYQAYMNEIRRPREWYEIPRCGFIPMRSE